MIDPTDDPDPTPARPNGRRGALEERVRKLETAVGELRDAVPTEEAVADRVLARLGSMAGGVRALPGPIDAEFIPADATPLATLAPPPEPVPSGAVLRPPVVVPPDPSKRTWFLVQLWAEVRLMVRMYFDPRYRVSRTAQFAVPAVIGLFALNYFVFAVWVSIAVISPITERVVGVLLGVFLYKILTRELTRYREVLEYMAKNPAR
jgi:hypothetical protein